MTTSDEQCFRSNAAVDVAAQVTVIIIFVGDRCFIFRGVGPGEEFGSGHDLAGLLKVIGIGTVRKRT